MGASPHDVMKLLPFSIVMPTILNHLSYFYAADVRSHAIVRLTARELPTQSIKKGAKN